MGGRVTRMGRRGVGIAAGVLALVAGGAGGEGPEPGTPPHRVFATSRFAMDEILTRPYSPDVPMGCTGDRVWASSPQGWAFADDVHWLYLTDLHAFDLAIEDEFGLLRPEKATYYPSHVHLEGAVRSWQGSASFTSRTDNAQNPLSRPFRPEKRWTCWSSGRRDDWYAVAFGARRKVRGLRLYFFDDAPSGECRPPERFTIERFAGYDPGHPVRSLLHAWTPVRPLAPEPPREGLNVVLFEPVEARALRLTFHHAGERFYTGLYGFEPIWAEDDRGAPPVTLLVEADKFITPDDVLVSVVRVTNPAAEAQFVGVDPQLQGAYVSSTRWVADEPPPDDPQAPWARRLAFLRADSGRRLHGQDVAVQFRFAVAEPGPAPEHGSFRIEAHVSRALTSSGRVDAGVFADAIGSFEPRDLAVGLNPTRAYRLAPGATIVFKAAMALHAPRLNAKALDAVIQDVRLPGPGEALRAMLRGEDGESLKALPPWTPDRRDPLPDQVRRYQAWFDDNLAYFDGSDPWARKMYYHRAYNLRKNMMDPKLGHLKWPTQAEGRWRSPWYPNVISYGAGHQVREARWLRDPKYWQGHLRTWAEDERPDGVYPSHVTPAGPQQGQYTDWITSTAWDGHLVHPDRAFLATVADRLAANVRGWQEACDPDGDGLYRVDSHWWTGMEWQPSFFAPSDYRVDTKEAQPERRVDLDRVDLTAYNYGNAVAVAKIYKSLGRGEGAREFEALAAKIAGAVTLKMWDEEGRFFLSTRADDGRKVAVKEVIGVYPFYFGMLPAGRGYESAWASILDPEQFWTPWPVASASKRCPAYSQDGWPIGPGGSGCMWNGPTWPHANSLVLSAMARSLRQGRDAGADSPLTREDLWALFDSFTRAQYRDQDLTYPWTGEFYHGETARWKTAERDYNHSTWLDVLIPDLLGLVPRDDDVLEVDPLLPASALSYFVLDGQRYRGHDVTIAWDAPGNAEDHHGDGRRGLDVYLDGRLVASAEHLTRLWVDLATGRRLEAEPAPR